MTSEQLRARFLEFFRERGHAILPSASLVPENDPTTLFTGSGMQPLIPYLLGESHPLGKRIANAQKSFRAEDIEEVGDNRHTTFFEMLGNWSFGDYWKEEQLSWFLEFLTKEVGINKRKLAVTCFEGDPSLNLPRDDESAGIWKKLGIPEERIYFYGAKKNWWSRSGPPSTMPVGEPGGPDSEVFYEFTSVEHNPEFGEQCHPNCDCGRFMELGNSVFMEYKKTPSGFEKLVQRNVDFGGGLERMTTASINSPDVFKIDVLQPLIDHLPDSLPIRTRRIIADHSRAMAFLIADGVRPSNKGSGYVLRRIMRRAMIYEYLTGDSNLNLNLVLGEIIRKYEKGYPELKEEVILPVYNEENTKFLSTVQNGLKEFDKLAQTGKVSGKDAFVLFSTYGLPYETTLEFAQERGIKIGKEEFRKEFEKHQELSRTSSAGMFKGGLADTSEKTIRLHTAHHLLLKALQTVIGSHVKQRGSNITQERIRMDFSHGEKMTEEQKREVERVVNEKIAEDLPVVQSEMTKEEAERLGAEHEFGQKYPHRVSVYSVGPKEATAEHPHFDRAFSIEICAGPHVPRTGVIGHFCITKEEGLAAGIRRIRAVVE